MFIEDALKWPGAKHIRVHEAEISAYDSRSDEERKSDGMAEHAEKV